MLKGRASLQCVSEVMRISSDGERIVLYSPGPGVQPGPQPPPSAGADAFYSYQVLHQAGGTSMADCIQFSLAVVV